MGGLTKFRIGNFLWLIGLHVRADANAAMIQLHAWTECTTYVQIPELRSMCVSGFKRDSTDAIRYPFQSCLKWVSDAVWAIGHKLKQINKDVAAAVSAVFLLLPRSLQEVWRWTGSLALERKFGAAGEVWRWSINYLVDL